MYSSPIGIIICKIVLFFQFIVIFSIIPNVDKVSAAPPSDYQLTFSEEFDSPTLNYSKWSTSYKLGKLCMATATDNALKFANGMISIELDKTGPATYSSGTLATHGRSTPQSGQQPATIFSQKYGWFEMRFKAPQGSAIHSAFWLVPENQSYQKLVSDGGTRQSTNEAMEIDIFEQLGLYPHNIMVTVHYGASYADNQHLSESIEYKNPDIDFSNNFHVIALEWLPDLLIWYLDGNEIFRSDKAPQSPFYIYANLYYGCGWTGSIDPEMLFPKHFDIDYIRVYKKVPALAVPASDPFL